MGPHDDQGTYEAFCSPRAEAVHLPEPRWLRGPVSSFVLCQEKHGFIKANDSGKGSLYCELTCKASGPDSLGVCGDVA